jgi:DNA-binding XRE family transcriptional regulator
MDNIETRNWRDVRESAERQDLIDPARVAQIQRDQITEVRAHRLAELRRSLEMTQQEVAEALHVSQPNVSQIERGDLAHSELGTIRAYVEALGGRLHVVADFGDQTITVE